MRTNADVPVIEILPNELTKGDFVGTLHGVAVYEVINANHYEGRVSVRCLIITAHFPESIQTETTLDLSHANSLARCYRPLSNLSENSLTNA